MLSGWLFLRFILLSVLFTGLTDYNSAQKAEPQNSRPIAIRAARMLDVAEGKIINDAVVLVEADKITAVGTEQAIPQAAEIVDLGDATILPGLIDAHTHITYHFDENGQFGATNDRDPAETLKYAEENARRTLEAGFTTIRNLGAIWKVDIVLRERIKRGEGIGPRMLVSGVPLTSYDLKGFTKQGVRIEMIRAFVRARIAEGADVIKIFQAVDYRGNPFFSVNEIRTAVEEAGKANLKVAVHAHEAPGVKAAVEAGAASIEHGTFLDDEAIYLLARSKTVLVPTLYLPNHYFEHKKQFAFDNSTWIFFEQMKRRNLENARAARRAGVQLVAGSDAVAGMHGNNAKELFWLTKAGVKPLEAIRAATIGAAELLGLEAHIGEIKRGKFADIIAVSGNPSDEISNLQRVSFVMKSGKIFKNENQTRN